MRVLSRGEREPTASRRRSRGQRKSRRCRSCCASTFSYAGAADPPGLSRERQGAGASAGVGVGVARAGAPREAAERRRGVPVTALGALFFWTAGPPNSVDLGHVGAAFIEFSSGSYIPFAFY